MSSRRHLLEALCFTAAIAAVSGCGGSAGDTGATASAADESAAAEATASEHKQALAVTTAGNCTAMPVTGKTYTLVNEGSGLALDVAGASTKDLADVIQWEARAGATNQQWLAEDKGNGNWTLRAVHSNKSLDVINWSKASSADIKQWAFTGNTNQQWQLSQSGTGSVKVASAWSKLLVSVADGKQGTFVKQVADSASPLQHWYFNPVDGKCAGTTTGATFLGRKTLLIGASANDQSMSTAPFEVRYMYVHSTPPPSKDVYDATLCPATMSWWGCWSGPTTAPGTYVTWNVEHAAQGTFNGQPKNRMLMVSWYSLRAVSQSLGLSEGRSTGALKDRSAMTRYMDDYRFLLKKLNAANGSSMLDLEPDFWGFAKPLNPDPHQIFAEVNTANPTDCADQENSLAGFSRCLIAMSKKYNARNYVGLHLSCFDAKGCEDFYKGLGAGNGDYLVGDVNDRDAGYNEDPVLMAAEGRTAYSSWWTRGGSGAADLLAFSKRVTEAVGKPLILWQIPLGNKNGWHATNHYPDDKVDWLFSHLNEVADAHIVGMLFGAGHNLTTGLETDGGNLAAKTNEYYRNGGTPIRLP